MTEVEVEPTKAFEQELDVPVDPDFQPIDEFGAGEVKVEKKRAARKPRASKPRAPRKKKSPEPEEYTPTMMDKVIEANKQAALYRAQLAVMSTKKPRKSRVPK